MTIAPAQTLPESPPFVRPSERLEPSPSKARATTAVAVLLGDPRHVRRAMLAGRARRLDYVGRDDAPDPRPEPVPQRRRPGDVGPRRAAIAPRPGRIRLVLGAEGGRPLTSGDIHGRHRPRGRIRHAEGRRARPDRGDRLGDAPDRPGLLGDRPSVRRGHGTDRGRADVDGAGMPGPCLDRRQRHAVHGLGVPRHPRAEPLRREAVGLSMGDRRIGPRAGLGDEAHRPAAAVARGGDAPGRRSQEAQGVGIRLGGRGRRRLGPGDRRDGTDRVLCALGGRRVRDDPAGRGRRPFLARAAECDRPDRRGESADPDVRDQPGEAGPPPERGPRGLPLRRGPTGRLALVFPDRVPAQDPHRIDRPDDPGRLKDQTPAAQGLGRAGAGVPRPLVGHAGAQQGEYRRAAHALG